MLSCVAFSLSKCTSGAIARVRLTSPPPPTSFYRTLHGKTKLDGYRLWKIPYQKNLSHVERRCDVGALETEI